MRKIVLSILISLSPIISFGEDLKCHVIEGEFLLWNGWPPALRLEEKNTGKIYGVNENMPLPKEMQRTIEKNSSVKGKFCIVEVGKKVYTPYKNKNIILVKVVSYEK